MTAPIDMVLPRLERVKSSGAGRWSACCPAHGDTSPSLSVRELDDGRLLIHCFGGCGVHEVLGALGLGIGDLFPESITKPGGGATRERKQWNAADLLRLAAHEATVCVLITCDIAAGRLADRGRLIEAASRLQHVVEAIDAP